MNIYVGNLSFEISENELREVFEEYGSVDSVKIIKDRDTGRSKGFGFVEMSDNSAAKEAMSALDSHDLKGRPLTVNEARPRSNNRRSGGNSGGGWNF